jgi:tol-pal system protein YbgF
MWRRLGLSAALLAASGPAWAANKDMERLQLQIQGLSGQMADLQRLTEDNLREVRRLNEALAEQNSVMKKSLQDQRVQDEGVQATLREISERLALIGERFQALQPSASAAPPVQGDYPSSIVPAPGAPPLPGQPEPAATAPVGSTPPPRELYSQAYADFARGNYDLAVQAFQEYLKNYPTTDFSDNAQYWIGECHYGKQRYQEAIEAWNTLLRDFPASDKLPDARVKKGMALERLGRKSQALLEYRYVVERFPNTQAARIAREKLNPQ